MNTSQIHNVIANASISLAAATYVEKVHVTHVIIDVTNDFVSSICIFGEMYQSYHGINPDLFKGN